ncbi:MAG: two-component system phosphate regulon sensor histidine kinase PhoR [Planctomycetota bacterium]|jgi:two-component system phosphate regulon sensor histidine kinase PhoR
MGRVSIFWKVFGRSLGVVLITALVIYLSVLRALEARAEAVTEQRVTQESILVAELAGAAWSSAEAEPEEAVLLRASQALQGARVTLISADGVVLFDSHEAPASMDNHLERSEIKQLGSVMTRFSRTLGKEMIYCAAPIMIEGQLRGYARIAIATVVREAQIAEVRGAVRNGILLAGLAASLLAAIFARSVTRPLTQIAGLIDEVGKGETSRRLHVGSRDEVGQLATTVNKMADEMATKIGRIERDKGEREAILAAMTDGLLALSPEQRVRFINRPACELLGTTAEAAKGAPLWEICRSSELNALLEKCTESTASLNSLGHFATSEGERIVAISAVPMAGVSEGDTGGWVLVLRDETELRHLEAVRRDFVSNVSHELKTPLTAMRGYVEAVYDDDEMPLAQRRSFLAKAQKNTERLTAIVSDLLSLSRLESEESDLSMEAVNASDLIQEAETEMADLAGSRRIELRTKMPEEPLAVMVDASAFLMAITNLISNAIQYSPEGAEVQLSARLEGEEVWFDVEDNGPGIPAQELDRVFERFYRIDKARSRTLGGTGLGLAIVRHAAAAHGGRVEVKSVLGVGSTFSLVLPVELA